VSIQQRGRQEPRLLKLTQDANNVHLFTELPLSLFHHIVSTHILPLPIALAKTFSQQLIDLHLPPILLKAEFFKTHSICLDLLNNSANGTLGQLSILYVRLQTL
jgi:hypothetical protein